jgi:hypothetical protein
VAVVVALHVTVDLADPSSTCPASHCTACDYVDNQVWSKRQHRYPGFIVSRHCHPVNWLANCAQGAVPKNVLPHIIDDNGEMPLKVAAVLPEAAVVVVSESRAKGARVSATFITPKATFQAWRAQVHRRRHKADLRRLRRQQRACSTATLHVW